MRCWSCERENRPGARFCATCGAGLGCPDCQAPLTPGQRFCTNCGRRAPVRGAQTIVRRIDRKTQETPHFRIRYSSGSYAEQQIGMIAGRLESAFAALTGLLGITVQPNAKIDVHLADLLDDPEQPGTPLAGGGFAVPERLEIREVYRADAPGDGLERSLVQVVLTMVAGGTPSLPALVQDGLLALVMQRQGRFPPDEQIETALGALKARGELPPLSTMLDGPAPGVQPAYVPAAAAFTGWLLAGFGPERFRDFVRRLPAGGSDAAARAAFGEPLAQLDKRWRKAIRVARPAGVMRFLRLSLHYLRPHRLKVAEIVVYIALAVAFGIGLQKIQQLIIDRALPAFDPFSGAILRPGDTGLLFRLMGVLVAAFALVSLTSLRESYLLAWVSGKVLMDLRHRIFTNLQRLEPAFYQRVQTGDVLSRMTSDIDQVEFALTGALAQGLRVLLTLVAAVVTIVLFDWKLAAVALAGTPLLFVAGRWLGPAAARASFTRQERAAEVTATLQENLAAQPVVKAFNLQDRMITNYRRALENLFRASLRLTFLSGVFGLSANSVAVAIQLVVLGVGGYLATRGELTVGVLLAFLGLMGQIIGTMQGVSGILQAMQQATGAMERVEEVLRAQPAIQDAPTARPIPPLAHAIRFEGVSFSYTGEQQTLRNLNLTIPAGANVAIVGPSGCGKSTVLNLILRFYDPQEGRVLFDGVDIREVTLDSLRGQIGIVFQENFLFNTSIRENIRLGNPAASDAQVEAAAKAAEIHDMIMAMPQGYDTVVGERGGRLSGGQRQRLAIARAILRNPTVLLLDEATSALDPRTEAAITETLDRLSRGRTTIAVTHRLSSVVNADQIYVFDRGMLAEQGTHDELLQRNGLYARLWQEQGGYVIGAGVQYVGVEAARLQGVPLFAQLDGDLLAALAQRLAVERYPAGDVIVNEGEPGDKLYVIHKGQAEVLAYDPAGNQRHLAVLREGDYFGEVALLYDVPRTATIRALTPVQLFSLSKEDFNILLSAVPGLRDQLERTISQREQFDAGG